MSETTSNLRIFKQQNKSGLRLHISSKLSITDIVYSLSRDNFKCMYAKKLSALINEVQPRMPRLLIDHLLLLK